MASVTTHLVKEDRVGNYLSDSKPFFKHKAHYALRVPISSESFVN